MGCAIDNINGSIHATHDQLYGVLMPHLILTDGLPANSTWRCRCCFGSALLCRSCYGYGCYGYLRVICTGCKEGYSFCTQAGRESRIFLVVAGNHRPIRQAERSTDQEMGIGRIGIFSHLVSSYQQCPVLCREVIQRFIFLIMKDVFNPLHSPAEFHKYRGNKYNAQ